ncbi:MAG TPA: translation initiation factor IF-3 [Polyangiales bacterium]|nr:translation initiation factor IF-3 [Polyangiales bacterium]
MKGAPFQLEDSAINKPNFDPRARVFSGPRVNERIRVPEVRVIGPDGEMLGILQTREAYLYARERELDLVEVNPKAHPPVCKVMDFGKYKYEEKKKQADARKRQTIVELKEIKIRPKTDDHDMEFKLKHIRRFLEEGDKVKITCRFRGREITHPETAQRQLDYMAQNIQDIGMVETTARMEGRTMTLVLAPKVSKAQMQVKKRQEEARRAKQGEAAAPEPVREELAPLTDQDDDDDDDEDAGAAEA